MISRAELNPKGYKLTDEQEANQVILHEKINMVRQAYGRPMVCTNGVRSWDEHVQIYIKKNQVFYDTNGDLKIRPGGRFPRSSQHLVGAAVDIADRDGKLWAWLMDHQDLVKNKAGLYLEDKSRTPTWVHFQIYPPKSGNWVFMP